MVAEEADPPDEAPALQILRGPEAEPVVPPAERELEDVGTSVGDAVVLLELGLRVDLRERLGILLAPLPEEQTLRPQLERDHDFASFQSSPTPTSTASAGSSG